MDIPLTFLTDDIYGEMAISQKRIIFYLKIPEMDAITLTVSRVSGCRVMSGRNAAYVYHLGHCQRNA